MNGLEHMQFAKVEVHITYSFLLDFETFEDFIIDVDSRWEELPEKLRNYWNIGINTPTLRWGLRPNLEVGLNLMHAENEKLWDALKTLGVKEALKERREIFAHSFYFQTVPPGREKFLEITKNGTKGKDVGFSLNRKVKIVCVEAGDKEESGVYNLIKTQKVIENVGFEVVIRVLRNGSGTCTFTFTLENPELKHILILHQMAQKLERPNPWKYKDNKDYKETPLEFEKRRANERRYALKPPPRLTPKKERLLFLFDLYKELINSFTTNDEKANDSKERPHVKTRWVDKDFLDFEKRNESQSPYVFTVVHLDKDDKKHKRMWWNSPCPDQYKKRRLHGKDDKILNCYKAVTALLVRPALWSRFDSEKPWELLENVRVPRNLLDEEGYFKDSHLTWDSRMLLLFHRRSSLLIGLHTFEDDLTKEEIEKKFGKNPERKRQYIRDTNFRNFFEHASFSRSVLRLLEILRASWHMGIAINMLLDDVIDNIKSLSSPSNLEALEKLIERRRMYARYLCDPTPYTFEGSQIVDISTRAEEELWLRRLREMTKAKFETIDRLFEDQLNLAKIDAFRRRVYGSKGDE